MCASLGETHERLCRLSLGTHERQPRNVLRTLPLPLNLTGLANRFGVGFAWRVSRPR